MINSKFLIVLALVSIILNVASQEQVQCSENRPELHDFLNVTSIDATEFEYVNCTSQELINYVGIGEKDKQIARFFLDGDYVIVTEGNVDTLYDSEEEYMGVTLREMNGYCWVYYNGLTLYGPVATVKSAINDIQSKKTLYHSIKNEEVYKKFEDAEYLWIIRGRCPYERDMKVYWAEYDGKSYDFYLDDEDGEIHIKQDSFDDFILNMNSEKYRKKKIKIRANMLTHDVTIDIVR
jgi:hypothetical protein